MSTFQQQVISAGAFLNDRLPNKFNTALLLGTGLSNSFLSNRTEPVFNIAYQEIPGMQQPAVASHQGEISDLSFEDEQVLVCSGRLHLYEGYSAQQVAFLIYVLAQVGITSIIVTNAAGALNPAYRPGDIMVIEDHINQTGTNPVRGQGDELGPRFTDMSQAYPAHLAAEALRIGCNLGLPMHLGVYAGVLGPTLETSAERRMLRGLGADAVGMSTIMEVIAANHCGMRVVGLSAISNMATGGSEQQPDTIDEVLANAELAGAGIAQIVSRLVSQSD